MNDPFISYQRYTFVYQPSMPNLKTGAKKNPKNGLIELGKIQIELFFYIR